MLEALLTPEDAALLLEMTVPVTAAQLAKRLDIDERSLSAKLDIFAERGLVFRGRREYHFKRGLHFGFARMSASEEYAPSMVPWFI